MNILAGVVVEGPAFPLVGLDTIIGYHLVVSLDTGGRGASLEDAEALAVNFVDAAASCPAPGSATAIACHVCQKAGRVLPFYVILT